MDFDEYEKLAARTATFDDKPEDYKLMYLTVGIAGEVGEIAEKIKKIMRNDGGKISEDKKQDLHHEIGDVLWYLSQLSRVLGLPLSGAAEYNIKKLEDRAARNVIKSTGDNR